ncbi:Cupredoxin [Hysterangium stoloniferum]|nr:Cupredoxin [Hysterangium stoloniferum]
MRFSTVVLFALPAAVLGAVQTVTVGADGALAYSPSNITAAVGDTVNFMFMAKNHTVTQSTFADPCVAAQFSGKNGVDSGFLAVPANSTPPAPATWSITITNATTPLWFHCAQTMPVSHCQKGMVFSINANAEKSFDAFKAAAVASTPAASPAAPSASSSPVAAAANAAASGSSTLNTSGAQRVGLTRGAAGTPPPPASSSASPSSSSVPSGSSAAPPATTSPSGNGAASLGTGKLLLAVAVLVALAL